ncbi:hypothetical protein PQX77_018669 [Marasmius sp. AFHP31]|nr:hypothetical protein PQX77_018669 [Marasmius sp. AFHP31]
MGSYFSHAQGKIIQDYATFRTVVGTRTIRRVLDGDIHFQRLLSSEILGVAVPPKAAATSSKLHVVKLRRMVQTAKISGFRGLFTAITLGPVNGKDREGFKEIAKAFLEAAMCGRSALLTQVFAMTESEALTVLFLDELMNGGEVVSQYRDKDWIVYHYLEYIHGVAIRSLRDDNTLTFPVTNRWGDWSINLQTLTCQYNPASLCFDPPTEEHLRPLNERLHPLRQDTLAHLTATEVVARVEEDLGDFLCLIASGGGRWIGGLSNYARNGLLTLGVVVDSNKPRILAHFASTPSPEPFCHNFSPDVKATYSGIGRVDLSFQKTGTVKVQIHFGLCIPYNHQTKLRVAYLCQSLHLCDGCHDLWDVVYIDRVGFCLEGTFSDDPATRSKPIYLFVPPLHTELINGLHCVRYPLPQVLFYWSSDPQGRNRIAWKDWERCGIPKMTVQGVIGSYWNNEEYLAVQEVFHWKKYDLDGRQYACDHRYPKLITGDPHDTARFQELEHSKSDPEPGTLSSPFLS